MKTLEQLGISPAPWNVGDAIPYFEEHVVYTENHRHNDGSRHNKVIATCNQYFEERIADARLIAAAPDMYEALYEAVKEKCTECHQINDYESDIGIEWQMCEGCPVKKWRAALAKAAGENEVKQRR